MSGLCEYTGLSSELCYNTPADCSISIRQAVVEDAPAIRDIMKNAFNKYVKDAGISFIPCALTESIEDICNDILNNLVYIAFFNGEPAGSLRLVINHEDKTAYLKRFGVKSEFNNMGIGKSLMSFVDSVMVSNNVNKLYLHTALNHSYLVKFYCGRGFFIESVSAEKGYDRALMVKEWGK